MTSLLRLQLRQRFHTLAASLALLVACGGSNSDGLFNPAGGTNGGAPASGGATSFGGAGPNGGSTPSGGSTPNGGSPAATGGSAMASGGSSAGTSSGGASMGGGSSPTGGTGAVGGSDPTTTGGTPSTGGGGASSGGTETGGSSTTGGTGSGGDPGGGATGGSDVGGSDAGGQGGAGGSDGGCQPGSSEICDGLDNDCNGRVDNGVGVCPTGCRGVALNGKGYMFCLTLIARTQERASSACDSNQMHLAWIDTAEENAAIVAAAKDIAPSVVSAWIGATDAGVEGEWRWVEDGATNGTQFWSGQANGMPVGDAYANWGSMRPDHGSGNEDCVAMTLNRQDFTPGEWDDEPCTSSYRFICEAF